MHDNNKDPDDPYAVHFLEAAEAVEKGAVAFNKLIKAMQYFNYQQADTDLEFDEWVELDEDEEE